jgi:cobalt-zinc-cadmium efflux system outer membrane protein
MRMKIMKIKSLIVLPIMLATVNSMLAESISTGPAAPRSSWVVTNSVPATNEITLTEFLNEVASANLDYAAQRYNVDVAWAAVAIAREFPNPNLDLGDSRDLRFHGSQALPQPASAGLDQTIEYFGKRKWRIRTAEQSYRSAAATLDDFLRNLKLDASEAFITALGAEKTCEQQREATEYLNQLAAAQAHRFKAGDIGETDLTQARVDELQSESDLLNAQNEFQVAQLALSTFLGRNRGQTVLVPQGNLEFEPRQFELSQLVVNALERRPDLVALRHARDSAQSGIHLARASRLPDVDVGVNYTHTTASENDIAPAPHDSMLGVSLSFPLPLWNRNRAEIQAAQSVEAQADKVLQSAELKAEVQVRQALTTYQLALERVRKFQGQLLKGADDVLTAKRFSYEHGNSTLDDLLMAQSADNGVHQAFNEALTDAARALMELDRAAGLDTFGVSHR